jgi:diacylglycerol O-acyltransferase
MQQNQQQSERLSWGDTVFLNLEREGMPLNVASVCAFEGKVSFGDFVRFVESKLPLIPRYLKRVVPEPLGFGLPTWEYDPDFDLRRHLRELSLKSGTETELKRVAGKLFTEVMDRAHPLWDMTLVHGLKRNRSGVIIRLHHCLADGIAGVRLMNVLFDPTPAIPKLRKRGRFRVPASRRTPLNSLANGVVDSYWDMVKRIFSTWTDLLGLAQRVATDGTSLAAEKLPSLLPEVTAPTERLHFNMVYRGPQKFVWAKIPLADVKTIKKALGASVNDVLLALVTATIRRYSELHGDRVKGRLLRMMVPVNLRGEGNPAELGNRISLVPVTVPLDIRNPKKLVIAVHQRTEFLKRTHAAEVVSMVGGLIGILPGALQALAGPLMSQLPVTPFNMVCTNVPGPQYPLYLLGHRMLDWYPYVPVGGELAVNCAILSYDGTVFFGFSGDVHAAPDLRRLEELLKTSFLELRQVATRGRAASRSRNKKRAKQPDNRDALSMQEMLRLSLPLEERESFGAKYSTAEKAEDEKALAELIA